MLTHSRGRGKTVRTLLRCGGVALVGVLLASCTTGGADSSSPQASEAGPSLPTRIPTVPPGSGLTTTPPPVTTTTPLVTTTAPAQLRIFRSPSGNIGCYVDSKGARCDIEDRDFQVPSKPASCPLVWGQGVEVDTGRVAAFVCASDSTLNDGTVLAYGTSIQVGDFECDSEQTGMSCRNTKTAHGFTLSKAAADLF